LGKLEIEDCACKFWAQDGMHDKLELIESKESKESKYMGFHPPVIIEPGTNSPSGGGGASGSWENPGSGPHYFTAKKGGLVNKTAKKTAKKATKSAKVVKTTAKKTASKLKKSKGK
jgi:hypothetical protein